TSSARMAGSVTRVTATSTVPPSLRWAVRLLILETAAAGVLAAFLVYQALVHEVTNLPDAVALTGFVVVVGAALAGGAAALSRAKARARAPAIVLQLLMVMTAVVIAGAGVVWLAVRLGLVGVLVATRLLTAATSGARSGWPGDVTGARAARPARAGRGGCASPGLGAGGCPAGGQRDRRGLVSDGRPRRAGQGGQHLPGERRGGRQRTVRARRDRERHLQILAADHEPALQQRGGRGQADQHGTGLVHRDPQILDLVQREPQPGRQARRGGPEYPQVRAVGGHREQDQVAVERWLGR